MTADDDQAGPRERWNRRWRARAQDAPARPGALWLTENAALLPRPAAGRALDVACGDGRNAAYLAELGFAVDAVDISDVAIAAVRAAATARGLPITARRLDLESAPLPAGGYAVIVQIRYLQRSLFAALQDALAPGGVLVAEMFARSPGGEDEKAANPRFALDHDELRHAVPALEVLRYDERTVAHSGAVRTVAAIVARRPR